MKALAIMTHKGRGQAGRNKAPPAHCPCCPPLLFPSHLSLFYKGCNLGCSRVRNGPDAYISWSYPFLSGIYRKDRFPFRLSRDRELSLCTFRRVAGLFSPSVHVHVRRKLYTVSKTPSFVIMSTQISVCDSWLAQTLGP